MPDSCSGLRTFMRCPYPPTFAAYADEIVRLASLSVGAALFRDAVQRLETSILSPEAPVDVLSLRHQVDFTLAAAADWSQAMDGLCMDDCLLKFHLARALPISYAPLRVTVRRIAPSTFGDYCAMLIALASVDTERLGRGLPALSANATDAFDFLRRLQTASLTLPPQQPPQLPRVSLILPSPPLLTSPLPSPILPLSPLPTLRSPTLLSPPLQSPLIPAVADVTAITALADTVVTDIADAAVDTVAVADVTLGLAAAIADVTLAASVVVTSTVIAHFTTVTNAQPVIWPGGASTRLHPLRHWPLSHRPRLVQHRCRSVRHRHRPPLLSRCHRSPLRCAHPIVRSNLCACTQVRRGCHRVCSLLHAPHCTAAWLSPQP